MAKISADDYARMSPNQKCLLAGKLLRATFHAKGRPNQIPFHTENAKVASFVAGRGSGKTWSASHWLAPDALEIPNSRCGILAPTYQAGTGTCLFGESGICTIIPDKSLWAWNERKYMLTLANGSTIRVFSSEHPRDMRGPEFHRFWIDEMADLSHGMECWKILFPAVRLKGDGPARIYCTGTPRATELMYHLIDRAEKRPDIYEYQRATTKENIANLDESTVEELYAQWEGTRYFLQEIEGMLLREAENALWSADTISKCHRAPDDSIQFDTVAIGVDPAVSTDKKADHTGIIVAGVADDKVYILGDYSRKSSPLEWSRMLVQIAEKHGAGTIVYERNLAGPLLRDVMTRTLDEMNRSIQLVPVQASGKKAARAEPIAALYEAGRVLHMPDPTDHSCGLEKLEKQMVQWEPTHAKSPDRIDALVHVVNHLLLKRGKFTIIRAGATQWGRK